MYTLKIDRLCWNIQRLTREYYLHHGILLLSNLFEFQGLYYLFGISNHWALSQLEPIYPHVLRVLPHQPALFEFILCPS